MLSSLSNAGAPALALPLLALLGSAVAWSILDACRKTLGGASSPEAVVVWLGLGQVPLFVALWAAEPAHRLEAAYALPGGLLVALNVAANVLFVRAVTVSPLGLTVPFLSLTPVFTALFAVPLLGEVPSHRQWLGIGVVVAGALGLNADGAGGERGPRALARAYLAERGSVLMTIVAVIWSVNVSVDKIALRHSTVATHALVQCGGVAAVLLGWLALRGRGAEVRTWGPVRGPLALAVVAAAAALGLQLYAVQHVLASQVEVVKRAVGLVGALAIGRRLYGEPLTRVKLVGAALMGVGTALVLA